MSRKEAFDDFVGWMEESLKALHWFSLTSLKTLLLTMLSYHSAAAHFLKIPICGRPSHLLESE